MPCHGQSITLKTKREHLSDVLAFFANKKLLTFP